MNIRLNHFLGKILFLSVCIVMGFLCVGLCFNYFISLKYSGGNNS